MTCNLLLYDKAVYVVEIIYNVYGFIGCGFQRFQLNYYWGFIEPPERCNWSPLPFWSRWLCASISTLFSLGMIVNTAQSWQSLPGFDGWRWQREGVYGLAGDGSATS